MKLLKLINTVNINEIEKMISTFPHKPAFLNKKDHSHSIHPFNKQQIRYSCEQFSVLQVHASNIIHVLEIYSWRFKTYLPITKAIHYALNTFDELSVKNQQKMANRFHNIFQKLRPYDEHKLNQGLNYIKNHPQIKTYDLYIKIQKIKFHLKDIDLLPLPQIIYLLKEMMIGYEVLIDIFGMVDPNDSMIMVNQQDQWKIWITHILQSTEIHPINIPEKQFIYRLIIIAQNHCVVNHLSKKFFLEVKELTYKQQCNFIKIIQKIQQFTIANKIFITNKVIIEQSYSPTKTLTKKKGFYRLQQMKCSLIDGKYIPNDHISANSSQFSTEGQISPEKKLQSMKNNETPQYIKDLRSNQSKDNWSTYQFYTPKYKINANTIHAYSPQIQPESNYFAKKMISSFPNTQLNNTICNSIIQKRRRSDQTANFDQKYKVTNQKHSQFHPNIDIIRQIQYKNQTISKQPLNICKNSKTINNNNDSFSHISTQKLKDSIRTDNPCTPNYSSLKKNDLDYNFKNIQNSYLNFSMHNQKEDKSLSVSHHFGVIDKDQSTPNQKECSQKSSQTFLKNTFSGLFSHSAPIRQLKTSIKIRSPEQIEEQQRYLSDINLEMLSKMGRHAKESFSNQEEHSTAGHIEQIVHKSGHMIDKISDLDLIKKLKDSQQQSTLLKIHKPKNEIVFGKNCVFLIKNNIPNAIKIDQSKRHQQ